MHRRLGSVDDRDHTTVPRRLADRRHIDNRAQHVRHMSDADHARLGPHGVDHRLRVQRPVRLDLDPLQGDAKAFAQEMPGHDIRVMLHHA